MAYSKHLVTRIFVQKVIQYYIQAEKLSAEKLIKSGPSGEKLPGVLFTLEELATLSSQQKKGGGLKFDINVLANAFEVAGEFSQAEMVVMLTFLLTHQGIKGYLSVNHQKLVLPANIAFPPVEKFFDAAISN